MRLVSLQAWGPALCLCLSTGLLWTSFGPCRAEDRSIVLPTPAPAEIAVRRATRECFTSLVHASGYFVPRQTAVILMPSAGYRVLEVRAKVGGSVARGDVVARLGATKPQGDKSKASEMKAVETVELKAPVAGVVLQSNAFEGMITSPMAKPLFTLAVDGEIEAAVEVPSVHILELKPGQPAHLSLRDGGLLEGRVRRTPAIVDPSSQMGTTRLSIDKGAGLEPSRFVGATIEARRSCGMGVPMSALRRTSAGTSIEVVVGDVITTRAVSLGLSNDTDSEVTSGLAEGDVFVAGAGSSRDGDRVKPVLTDPTDQP